MATVACRILKFEAMIEKLIVKNHAFFTTTTTTTTTFSRIISFAYINFIIIQNL